MRSAARISDAVIDAIVRLDDPKQPLAETARRVAAFAEERGEARPSYEALRRLIKQERQRQRTPEGPSIARLLVDSGAYPSRYVLDEMLKPRDERRRLR